MQIEVSIDFATTGTVRARLLSPWSEADERRISSDWTAPI
jgi:hypothetical protein